MTKAVRRSNFKCNLLVKAGNNPSVPFLYKLHGLKIRLSIYKLSAI